MSESDTTWNLITTAFPILLDKETGNLSTNEELEDFLIIAYELNHKHLVHWVEDLIIDKIEQDLRQKIAPTFWEKFNGRETESDGFEKFKNAVDFLYDSSLMYLPTIERMKQLRSITSVSRPIYGEVSLINVFKTIVRATLHSQLPLRYQVVTEDFYRVTFKVQGHIAKELQMNMDKELDPNDSTEDVLQCNCEGCGLEVELCNCRTILEIFNETNRKLIELDLLERLAGEVLTSLIHKRIENHVQETCKGCYDTSHISSLENVSR